MNHFAGTLGKNFSTESNFTEQFHFKQEAFCFKTENFAENFKIHWKLNRELY